MDHFNVTVQRDGVLVATRRGLQVSKQKHHGISLVNSSCPQPKTAAAAATTAAAAPAGKPQRWKFVTKDRRESTGRKPAGGGKAKAKAAPAGSEASKRCIIPSKPACSKQLQPQPPSPHDLPTPPETDEEAASRRSLQPSLALYAGMTTTTTTTTTAGVDDVPKGVPGWTAFRLPLTPQEQRLFYTFFAVVPRKMYPYEDILTYNPARSREFYWAVITDEAHKKKPNKNKHTNNPARSREFNRTNNNDEAAMQCVLMCNAMFRSVLSGRTMSEELAYHMSRVCAIINRQLDEKPSRIPNITIECITTLALMSVSNKSILAYLPSLGLFPFSSPISSFPFFFFFFIWYI